MKISRCVTILFAVISVCNVGIAQKKRSAAKEQLSFSAEDTSVKRPIVIPNQVLSILRKDEFVRQELQSQNIPAEQLPPSWFSASRIHLCSPDQMDLVVIGEGPLMGANIDTFWILRATHDGYEVVLKNGAHDLIVKSKRLHGYREIEMSAETASEFTSVLFGFDGKQYAELSEKSEPIK